MKPLSPPTTPLILRLLIASDAVASERYAEIIGNDVGMLFSNPELVDRTARSLRSLMCR